MATAGGARAAEYDVWSCTGPDGQALSAAAWEESTDDAEPGDVSMTDDCATGGPAGLHVNDAGVPGGRSARIILSFDLPPGGAISDYEINRSIRTSGAVSGYNYAAAIRETSGATNTDWGCASYLSPPYFNCSNLGSPTNPGDPGNLVNYVGPNLTGLGVWAACWNNGCSAPFSIPAAEFNLFSSRVSVVDNDPPTLTGLGGALIRAEAVRGKTDLFVDAADVGGGVRSLTLAIDGGAPQTITADTTATCAEPFEVPEPCPAQLGRIFTVDTTLLTEGFHSAGGTITDAAGNSTPYGPVSFVVQNKYANPGNPTDPDNGTPPVADPEIRLDRAMVDHAPGKAASITGRLLTSGGQPIAGAGLEVTSISLGGTSSEEVPLAPVTTGADGRFTVENKGLGARRITVSFAPVVGGVPTRRASATLRSKLKLKFKAKPRRIRIGKAVKFTGKIVGGGPSVRGATTEIQAKAGGRWQTVANVSAKASGKFRWKYRFRHVERNAIFSFRALVRSNPGWPWPTVKSKKLKVRIRVPGS